jgi:hypothetical protein
MHARECSDDRSVMSYHTREYIEANWSILFQILNFIPRGVCGFQDLVVLQKR